MDEQARRRPGKVSDEELVAAAAVATNMRQLLLSLGIAAYGGNYESIRDRLRRLGVDAPRLAAGRRRVRVTREDLERVVQHSDSYAQVARLLGLGDSSSAQVRAKRLVLSAGLDHAHFLGRAANRGVRLGGNPGRPLTELLVQGRSVKTSALKRRLLREGVLPPRCSTCLLERWGDGPVPLELDHISGDRTDNRLENLRLLCPNCHAQTDTYRGRNIGGPLAGARDHRGAREVESAQVRAAASRARLSRLFDGPRPAAGVP